MTIRKRRQPTPSFKLPPPYQPITGERETLAPKGIHPYCALMQVAEEDTHDNYLICRGFDTRIGKFIDYEAGNADKPGIPVAKPYGARGTFVYSIGEVYPAYLPVSRLGQNPGKAETTVGHPEDLDEEVVFLLTDEGQYINWMIVEAATQMKPKCRFTLDEALAITDEYVEATIVKQYGHGKEHDETVTILVYNMPNSTGDYEFYGDSGDYGTASYAADPDIPTRWEIDIVECP